MCFDPPAYLRLSDTPETNYTEQLISHVPACYANGTFKLGDDFSSVSEKSGPNAICSEKEGYSFLSWKEQNQVGNCDTLIHCTFRSGLLVAFSSLSRLKTPVFSKELILDDVQSEFNCISEIRQVLEFGKNLSYSEESLAFIQEFRLTTEGDKYSGLRYELRYPDAPSYFNPLVLKS